MGFLKFIGIKIKKLLQKIQQLNFMNLDKGSNIGKGFVVVESVLKGKLNINNNVSVIKSEISGEAMIESNTKVLDSKLKGKISIGSNSKVIDGVCLDGDISIGSYTTINGPNTDLKTMINKIVIGNFCSIARNVSFQEYNHDFNRLTSYFVHRNLENKSVRNDVISKGNITLGHDVWIGTHCVILSGSTIGTGAVIAANSVVTGDIPPYAIAAGSPAKVIKYRFDEKTIADLLASNWWHKEKDEILNLFNNFKGNN